ncbi:hypothetical protein ACPOL_6886 (plasmid) [Acidisarcina polymorpha]|uniref:Uncharacterized protein n=1 Tax=Acidisarcina polymorpha TaxID=2211140 RepID=A0A2Z5GBL2_9BACT|nr:hypothetical protein ACPOL_6886 [Acidisarcina polymorpha]
MAQRGLGHLEVSGVILSSQALARKSAFAFECQSDVAVSM